MVKPVWNNAQRVNHQNFARKTHPCAKKNIVPRVVLMKSGLVSINTAKQNISKTAISVSTARQVNTAHSKTTVNAGRPMPYLSKTAHSTDKNVNDARPKAVVNAARPKAVVNDVKGNNGNPQMELQDKGVIDNGCSRHMTRNMSYLTDYKEIDEGYVSFRGNPKGGKIIGKYTIKTDTKDETSGILKSFITGIENLVDHKVKVIKCDNRTEFKNREINQFYEKKYHLGKFDGKADEGLFVGYSLNSKAYRVFNSRTRIVEENLHIRFSENTPNVVGTKASDNADPKSSQDDGSKPSSDNEKKVGEDPRKDSERIDQ
ncbi:ribonuclease H-like domain-containing protein [Tanacetum coccineum]